MLSVSAQRTRGLSGKRLNLPPSTEFRALYRGGRACPMWPTSPANQPGIMMLALSQLPMDPKKRRKKRIMQGIPVST